MIEPVIDTANEAQPVLPKRPAHNLDQKELDGLMKAESDARAALEALPVLYGPGEAIIEIVDE